MKDLKFYVVKFFESGRTEYFIAYSFDLVIDYVKLVYPDEDFSISEYKSIVDYHHYLEELYKVL